MPRPSWYWQHVHVLGGADLAVVDVEAVGEEERLALGQVRGDLGVVDPLLGLVRDEDHDDVGLGRGLGHRDHPQPGPLGLGLRLGAGPQADPHVHARVAQVEGVRVPLAAVADDRHLALLQQAEVGVLLVVDLGHVRCSPVAT